MKDDPVIRRVREARRKISEEYGHDTERLIKHYQDAEKKTARKFFERGFHCLNHDSPVTASFLRKPE